MEEDDVDDEENQEEDVWGGSDEEVRVHSFSLYYKIQRFTDNHLAGRSTTRAHASNSYSFTIISQPCPTRNAYISQLRKR